MLSRSYFTKNLTIRFLGTFIIIFSLLVIIKTFASPLYQELKYFLDHTSNKTYIVSDCHCEEPDTEWYLGRSNPDKICNYQCSSDSNLSQLLKYQPAEILIPPDPAFSIIIPKIAASARIIANVDANREQAYLPALKKGVAHARGSYMPGENGLIYLFAHSTDYFYNVSDNNAVFYLINKLEFGDEINIFYRGVRYKYQVIRKEIVSPDDIRYLTADQSAGEQLILQTCWPPGTAIKRLLVIARK